MAPCVQYAAIFVYAVDVYPQLLLEYVELVVEVEGGVGGQSVEVVAHLLEYPRASEGGATHHHRVYAIALKRRLCLLRRGDIAVADDGYMYARVALHLADERPVRLTSVHLRTCSAVYGERLYAAVLQSLGEIGYHQILGVPAQTCLHRHGGVDSLHHFLRDFEQERNVLQHAGAGTLACHLLDGATEVYVYDVGARLFHYLCRLHHGVDVASVDLYAHGTLLVADGQLVHCRLYRAHERLSTDKLGVDHRCSITLAQQSEADVCDVFHRCEEDGMWSKFYISYFHIESIFKVNE